MVFQCACCSKFNDLESLTTHVQKYGHAHRCSTCSKFFKSKDQLLAHRKDTGHEQPAVSMRAKQASLQHQICSCGRRFKALQSLRSHQQDVQHIESAPKKPLIAKTLPPPKPAVATCSICNKRCANADGLKAHKADRHPCCPICKQQFPTLDSCAHHQRAAGHCYCREHEESFRNATSYKLHIRNTPHVTGFECVDCNRAFKSQVALGDHLASPGHASVLQSVQHAKEAAQKALKDEEARMRCEQCKRDFKTVEAYQQHRRSLKHKPLSKLIYPLSSQCKKTFPSPSSLLSHLESGGCESGMSRLKLNALVHQFDTGRQMTFEKNVVDVMATAGAAGVLPTTADMASLTSFSSLAGLSSGQGGNAETSSTFSGVLVEAGDCSDTESIDSCVSIFRRSCSLLGPSGGGGDVDDQLLSSDSTEEEWSFLENINSDNSHDTPPRPPRSEFQYDTTTESYPCIIKSCSKSFKTRARSSQHLYSPFHAPKLFRCPITTLSSILKQQQQQQNDSTGKHEREFKTLSGFAMHLESGKCVTGRGGGEEALREIAGLFERRIKEATGREFKLLM